MKLWRRVPRSPLTPRPLCLRRGDHLHSRRCSLSIAIGEGVVRGDRPIR